MIDKIFLPSFTSKGGGSTHSVSGPKLSSRHSRHTSRKSLTETKLDKVALMKLFNHLKKKAEQDLKRIKDKIGL